MKIMSKKKSDRRARWKARFKKLGQGLKKVFLFWWSNGGKEKTIKKVKSKFKK